MMRNAQKLEIFASTTTLLIVSFFYYVNIVSGVTRTGNQANAGGALFWTFLFIVFPVLLTVLGSYLHVFRQSKFGILVLVFSSSFSILICSIGLLLGLRNHGQSYALITIIWGVFAALTIISAISSERQAKPSSTSFNNSSIQVSRFLETAAGISGFVTALMYVCFIDLPQFLKTGEQSNNLSNYNWTGAFLVLVLPSLLIAVGSYFHAYKRSEVGLAVIIVVGAAKTSLTLFLSLLGGFAIFVVAPGIFAFFTIVLALFNTSWAFIENKKLLVE